MNKEELIKGQQYYYNQYAIIYLHPTINGYLFQLAGTNNTTIHFCQSNIGLVSQQNTINS